MKFIKLVRCAILILFLTLLICTCSTKINETPEHWSMAALADPRSDHDTFENALIEVRDHNVLGTVSTVKFILVCGDYDPLSRNVETYENVFRDIDEKPEFVPVIGNHDLDISDFNEAVEIIKTLDHVTRRDDKLNYYIDFKNVRIIAVNTYSEYFNDLGAEGCLNTKGIEWINDTISSAIHADHVFIAMHEPSFPRMRHIDDSFNACMEERNTFWDMLVSYNGKVKAVFVGHTHYYYRMRVKDPRSAEADDPNEYPDQEGGVYQVDCGACGNGVRNTVVNIEIMGKDVLFKVADAVDGPNEEFSLIDEWRIITASQ